MKGMTNKISTVLTAEKKYKHLKNKRFGELVFLRLGKLDKYRRFAWFQCDCGKKKEIRLSDVKFGATKSCCKRWISNWRHGMRWTRLYQTWTNIKTRTKSKGRNRKYYLDKGIGVCDRWQIFKNFMEDMVTSYETHVKEFGEKETELDRIDNNKGYELNNCRWVTQKKQWENRNDKRIKKSVPRTLGYEHG